MYPGSQRYPICILMARQHLEFWLCHWSQIRVDLDMRTLIENRETQHGHNLWTRISWLDQIRPAIDLLLLPLINYLSRLVRQFRLKYQWNTQKKLLLSWQKMFVGHLHINSSPIFIPNPYQNGASKVGFGNYTQFYSNRVGLDWVYPISKKSWKS